jgi:4-hydroxy-3-methylbut-2-enyl diphosphate reductase
MKRLIFDKNAGLCPGVQRTIIDAIAVSKREKRVASYGELIHNPFVVGQLSKNGITVADSLDRIKKDQFIIIRAHGIAPVEEEYLKNNGIRYMDLTCPRVKTVHRIITEYANNGYGIVIVGNPRHPETIGHLGFSHGKGTVVSSIADAENLKITGKILVLAQTTISTGLFESVLHVLMEKSPTLETVNTICSFTTQRQSWIATYSKKVDLSIIIGGKKSSNTAQLYEIALKSGATQWIEDPSELDMDSIAGFRTVALTAGTSTPDEILEKAIVLFKKNGFSVELC